jgi:hypothetical protein
LPVYKGISGYIGEGMVVHENCRAVLPAILIFMVSVFHAPLNQAEGSGEFFAFPSMAAIYRSDLEGNSTLDHDDYEIGLDLFTTYEYKNLNFLGEYLLTNEHQEIERIQIGLILGNSNLWLGKFHNPIGYWNTQYHHGAYLETSSSRPAIVEFGDNGGILPMHTAGLLLEGEIKLDKQGLGYNLSVGVGPELTGKIATWDVLNPDEGDWDINTTLNLYFEPVLYEPTRYGFYVNYTEIVAELVDLKDIRLVSAGIYGNWVFEPWRIIASSFYVHNRLVRPVGSRDDDFFSAYLQTEYNLNDKWVFYGRLETTFLDKGDAYLALFPEFTRDRIVGGIRLNIVHHNSLKLEISGNRTNNDDFGWFMLQWDAMF